MKSRLPFFLSVLAVLLLWQILAVAAANPLILPSVASTCARLFELCSQLNFWRSVLFSAARVFLGFFLVLIFGGAFGVLCGVFPKFRAFMAFPLAIIRSVPVVSFILLAIFAFKSDFVPVFSAFLMGFPVMTSAVSSGFDFDEDDKKLFFMAKVFRLTNPQKIRFILLPKLRPFLESGIFSVFGMSWKVVAAAEVLSVPKNAIGAVLQNAEVHLESETVLAATIVLVVLSFLCEKVLRLVFAVIYKSFSSLQTAPLSGLQKMSLSDLQKMSLSDLQKMSLSDLQNVSLSGLQNVSLSGLQNVSLSGLQNVSLSGLTRQSSGRSSQHSVASRDLQAKLAEHGSGFRLHSKTALQRWLSSSKPQKKVISTSSMTTVPSCRFRTLRAAAIPNVGSGGVSRKNSRGEFLASLGKIYDFDAAPQEVKITNLNISFGEKVLFKNFSITFEAGKVTAILAPSGSGKTTLLNWIATHYAVSFLFQEPRLLPTLTVFENVFLPLSNIFSKDEAAKIAKKYLEKAELSDKLNRTTENLSGGEKQRVAMARAFAFPSPILLLDEAFQSLDEKIKNSLEETLKSLLRETPRTVIFVTHQKDEAEAVADKIVEIKESPLTAEELAGL